MGLVAKNDGVYGWGGPTRDWFYAPPGLLDDGKVTIASTNTVAQVLPNTGLDTSATTMTWRGKPVRRRGQVDFQIAGQPFHLPAVSATSVDLMTEDNIAGTAKVTASGSENGYSSDGAVDGIVGGYPQDKSNEWSAGQKVGATLTLTWDTPQTIDRIVLYDRPNLNDQVTSGEIAFSDGSSLLVGALPDDASKGFEMRFPPKTITSLTFKVTGLKDTSENAGLSEIAVYRVGAK